MKTDRPECGPIRERLAELIYGELDSSARSQVMRHVEGCAECREELAELERVRAVMRSTQHQELPPGLEARVMSEARRAAAPAEKRSPERGSPMGWLSSLLRPPVLRPALGVALTVLVVAGIAWLLSERRGSVVERYLETPQKDLAPRIETPAVPPETAAEAVEEELAEAAPAEPPYPTAGIDEVDKEEGEVAGKAGVLAQTVTETRAGEKPGYTKAPADEPFRLVDDAPLAGAVSGKAKGAAPPPAAKAAGAKDIPEDGLAGLEAGGDLDATMGDTKAEVLKPKGAATGGYAEGLEEPAAYDFAANMEPKPAEEPPPVSTAAATPAKPAPSPPPAPAGPSYAPPAPDLMADLEADEAPAEEAILAEDVKKPSKKKGKKSIKEKWKEWKAKKKADKAAKKVQKEAKAAEMEAGQAEKSAPAPGAAAQAPAKEAPQDPFDEAMARKKKKDYDGAIAILKTLKKNPSSTQASQARVLHQLAWCTARTGDTDKALVYYENLFAKYPGYTGKHQAMWEAADLYLTAGDKKHASSLLEKLAEVSSWEKKARKKLEKIK